MRVLAGVAVLCLLGQGCGGALAADSDPAWAAVLARFVDDQGRVDFQGLSRDRHDLDAAVAAFGAPGQARGAGQLAASPPGDAGAPGAAAADGLAFHINVYNALAMAHVLDRGTPRRLSWVGRLGFFVLSRVVVHGRPVSLYNYENDVIRPIGDERAHFALNCMSVSCPRLPRVPFHAATLDAGLDAAARRFLAERRNVAVDPVRHVLRLSSILSFYQADFLTRATSLAEYVNRYRVEKVPVGYRVEFVPYDWTINAQPAS